MDVSGWPGGPTLIQRILPSPTSLRTSNPRASRQKPREALGSSCGRVLVWILMSMEVTLRALAARASRFLIGLVSLSPPLGRKDLTHFAEARPRGRSVA